jgi:hypothetical protein
MSDEINVSIDIRVKKDNLDEHITARFTADMDGDEGGVTPGQITVPTTGIAVDFSELTQAGVCTIQNLDQTNYVTIGVKDTGTNRFYPLDEILPGETWARRISRKLGKQFFGTGTGTGTDNVLWLDADTAACRVVVKCFEK